MFQAWDVPQSEGPYPSVIHKKDTISLPRKISHDLLVSLPDEIPVDRRDAEDALTSKHGLSCSVKENPIPGLEHQENPQVVGVVTATSYAGAHKLLDSHLAEETAPDETRRKR